ncbi:MAG: hypothetical protein ACHQIH_02070 [Ignavibacteria bacterium]
MNDQIITNCLIEIEEPEYSSLSKRAKYLSLIYFTISVSFFGASFIPFLIKRVEGNDPHMVSGAHAGSMQLLFFVLINIAALIVFLMGNSLLKFSSEIKNTLHDVYNPEFKKTIIPLESFFTILGVLSILAFAACIIAVLNLV